MVKRKYREVKTTLIYIQVTNGYTPIIKKFAG